jgi:predicted O-linked N-acetylglucosamine transferase (SPINDLY family)
MVRDIPPGLFQQAVMLYQQRRLPDADKVLSQILQRAPNHGDALHLAGIVAQEIGRPQRAASLLAKAVKLHPGAAPLHDALAIVLNALGQRREALTSWDRAVRIDPAYADAWVNRGTLLKALNRVDEAVASYDRALAIEPNFAEAHYNRALSLSALRHYEAALEASDRAIALNPGFADAHFSRGTILADMKRDREALVSFQQAIALKPDHAEAIYNIGTSLLGLSRMREAIEHFDRAIALKPDHADAYRNRGVAQQELGLFEDAIASQEKALALRPDFAFLDGDLLHLRLTVCDWNGLAASVSRIAGRTARGKPVCSPFASLLVSHDPALQRRAAKIYVAAKYPADNRLGPIVACPSRGPQGDKIRIGYFSADFREHPVSQLMIGLFEKHDRSRFHIVGFAFGPDAGDAMAARVANSCDEFIDVRAIPDHAVAQLAREKGIDIAVDLGGCTNHARTGIFALRAAPVQVGYIGYLGTMGADYFDYIIADRVMIPEVDREHYAEKVAYLPSFQSNPSDRAISVAPASRTDAGLPEVGFVFCCFNSNFKVMPDVFSVWLRILQAAPGSVLWLYILGDAAERNIRTTAEAAGLAPERIVFARRLPHAEFLSRLRLADLFLDTSPYNAGTTASDALWMGLPVLTRLGETFAGRMAASLLTAVGMPELIALSPGDYEAIAIDLARNPVRIADIRRKLAQCRATSRLFDTKRFARDIEAAYAAMVERYHAGLPPEHIHVVD